MNITAFVRISTSGCHPTIARGLNTSAFVATADARMPIWGVSAILSNFLLVALSRSGQRWFYFASLLALILFVATYARVSKPINRVQTEAAKTGERLKNGRELQASWDISVMVRVPLLVVSVLGQCLVLLVASAQMWLVRSPLKSQELFGDGSP